MSAHLRRLVYALLLGVGWLVLGPSFLGGPATYVATHGISMEPGFQTGDLAVLRAADRYQVGDVAAYRSEQLDTVVMHRIVAREDGRLVFQGDNNSWLDPETFTEDELIGELAFRVPNGGLALRWLTNPWLLGVAAFALAGAGGIDQRRHRSRRRKKRLP